MVKNGKNSSRQKDTVPEEVRAADACSEHVTLLNTCVLKLDLTLDRLYICSSEFWA
jgi:hypothetical protein